MFKKNILCLSLILSNIALAKNIDIEIISTSDVHGRVIPWEYSSDSYVSGSFSQIDTFIKNERKNKKNIILVDVGDAIQDNYVEKFSNIFPNPVVKVMNTMGYDIFVPGNHEFNFGMNVLENYKKNFKGNLLISNLFYNNGTPFSLGSTVIKKDGVKIGFIGVTTPLIKEFEADSGNLKNMKVESPEIAIKKEIEKLKKEKVDAIVLVAHMGYDNENSIPNTGVKDIANKFPEIDLILAGHAHKNISNKLENNVLITEPYKYGKKISIVNLKFDDKKLIDKKSKTIEIDKKIANSKRIDNIYKPYHNRLRDEANVVIGYAKNPLVPQQTINGVPSIYAVDTGLSTLLHNVMLHYSGANVVAISLDRDDPKWEAGKIRRKDIAYNYRYTGGEISVYLFTGKDLKDYMEWSADYFDTLKPGERTISFNKEKRKFKYSLYDQFGGVTYDIDLREKPGNRIKNLKLFDGRAVTDNMRIKVGMNSYRYDMLTKKGGILEGRNIPLLWNSKEKYGEEKGTIRYLTERYIIDKKVIDGLADNNWKIIGISENKK